MDGLAVPAAAEAQELDAQSRIGELFDRHHARLHLLARRMCGEAEEARDLVQETFLRAAHRPDRIPEEPDRAEAWLVRVLVNLCRDRRRRLRVRAAAKDSLPDPMTPRPSEPALFAAEAVRGALASLPARQRAVLVLHELEELPVRDVAALLGVGAVTVRWHLSRARRSLRLTLGEERKR